MKRNLCVLVVLAVLMMLCCACSETPAEPEVPADDLRPLPEAIPVVVPIGERTEDGVKVTIHGGLLGERGEELSEQQIADGFIDAVRNEDDSVTYTIATDKYDALVARYRADARAAILYTVEDGSYYSLKSIDCAEDLSEITFHVDGNYFRESMDELMVFGNGMIAITAQAYDLDAPGTCVLRVFDENGEQIVERIYPDELVV